MAFRYILLVAMSTHSGVHSMQPDGICQERRSPEINKAYSICCQETPTFLDVSMLSACEREEYGNPQQDLAILECTFRGMGFMEQEGVFQPHRISQYLEKVYRGDPELQVLLKRTLIDECLPMTEAFRAASEQQIGAGDAVLLLFSCGKFRINLHCPDPRRNDKDEICHSWWDLLEVCSKDMVNIAAFIYRKDLY